MCTAEPVMDAFNVTKFYTDAKTPCVGQNMLNSKRTKNSLFPEAAFRNFVRSTLGGLLGFGGGGPKVNKGGRGFRLGVAGSLSPFSFSWLWPHGPATVSLEGVLGNLAGGAPDADSS